jgi:guanylate kinase
MRLSVSATTRGARPGEADGVAYYFWDVPEFLRHRDADEFLEWAEVHGNYYGTPKSEVLPFREKGLGVVLDIDVKGWEQVKKRCPDVVSIFVQTSTFAILEERLRNRRTESEEALQRRLNNARTELLRAPEYDHQVINDDLEPALASLQEILSPLFQRSENA